MTGSAHRRAKANASTRAECAGQEAARDYTLLHVSGSVAGEAEEMPCVVHELVHMGVAAEERHRTLVDADEVQRQQRQESGCRQPQGGACRRQVDRARRAVWTELDIS